MSSQFPQVFKSPQLSIYSRSSGSRRLPDRYQKSIGMNIRRDPKDNMRRKYVSDADLLGPETKSEYSPGTALERRADAEG